MEDPGRRIRQGHDHHRGLRGQERHPAAKITENLGLPATCGECSGQYKGKPFVGIVTLSNLKANKDGSWSGSGYKPSDDRKFNAKSVKLVDGGNKLEVKGCVAFICKTATWVRAH